MLFCLHALNLLSWCTCSMLFYLLALFTNGTVPNVTSTYHLIITFPQILHAFFFILDKVGQHQGAGVKCRRQRVLWSRQYTAGKISKIPLAIRRMVHELVHQRTTRLQSNNRIDQTHQSTRVSHAASLLISALHLVSLLKSFPQIINRKNNIRYSYYKIYL